MSKEMLTFIIAVFWVLFVFFLIIKVLEEDYGKFYSGDCYIILYAYNNGGKDCYLLYYWLVTLSLISGMTLCKEVGVIIDYILVVQYGCSAVLVYRCPWICHYCFVWACSSSFTDRKHRVTTVDRDRLGVNFTNILRAAFMRPDPKSAKKTVNLSSFLRFQDLWA